MDYFWSESIWCPPGMKWSEYKPDSAQFRDLYYAPITALMMIIIRYVVEKVIFIPIGRYVAPKKKSALLKKIGEGLWRFYFYLAMSIYGWLYVLWDKPYLTDTMYTLKDYPNHPVTPEEWWYYNLELGFYIALVITQFTDTRRKDFWQMFLHHIITILLLVLSWACNFHRIGCLVIAIHDIGDIPLEGAKLAKYCEKQRLADLIFAIFTVVWIYTRCYLLPARVIYYTAYKALSLIPFFPAYYIFNALLCVLQLLHFVWTYIIIKMVFDALQNDGMRDLRSDSEDSDEKND